MKRFLKILRTTFLILIGVIILSVLLINYGPVQNFITQKAVVYLSEKLNTEVKLEHFRFKLFNKLSVQGLYIPVHQQDTLIYIGELNVDITDWFFLRKNPAVHQVLLKDVHINLERPFHSEIWNYQFIINAFGNNKNKIGDKNNQLPGFDLEQVELENVRFLHADKWVGTDYTASVASLKIETDKVDLRKGIIDVNSIFANEALFGITEYTGGRPPYKRSIDPYPIDSTPFNPANWIISAQRLVLKNSRFFLEYPERNTPVDLFDETHLNITGINADINDIVIEGDTVRGHVNNLKAKERCGIEINKMNADVSVSPVLSECKNLLLETNNSVLKDYYAMRYSRFPDFLNYISDVVMEAKFDNTSIGIDDIIFFAPEMKWAEHKSVFVSGNAEGTVASFRTKDILIQDGISKLTGDIAITGLPEIEDTYLDWQYGAIAGRGEGLLPYFPALKEQDQINITSIGAFNLEGSLHGFLNNFYLDGTLNTELGSATFNTNFKFITDVKPEYKGEVALDKFHIGKLFNLEQAEQISLESIVNGKGFSPDDFELVLEGKINKFQFYNYNYRHITVEGIYNPYGFDGQIISRDENLSFDLDGKFRLGREQNTFNCVANVLHINTKAIGITNNTIEGSAKLALNFSGLDLDEFNGDISITRIFLLENNIPLSLEALYIEANVSDNGYRNILLQTNGVNALAKGRFSIKELPDAFYDLLSGYVPAFVSVPDTYDPNQELNFILKTESTDDIFRLLNIPLRLSSGINLEGYYQGKTQQMYIKGQIPWLSYNQLFFDQIGINIAGDMEGLNTSISFDKFNVGDYVVSEDAKITANVLSNLATFKLTTGATGDINTAVIAGNALARNDSFYVSVLESGFYFNRKYWFVKSGNSFVFADDYLSIENVALQSDAQKIFINKNKFEPNKAVIELEQIELTPINNMLDYYTNGQIQGKINGTITVEALYPDQYLTFDLNTNNLKLNETIIGKLHAMGDLDIANKSLVFKKGSQLYLDGNGVEVVGEWNWKSNKIKNGLVNLNHAPLNWLNPVLEGYCKDVSGKIDGYLSFDEDKIKGEIKLNDISATAEINGVSYKIPEGKIFIDNKTFELPGLMIRDADGNYGMLTGTVQHDELNSLFFNLKFNSPKIKVVSLSKPEGDYFYGSVWSDVKMNLTGNIHNLKMDIIATPKSQSKLFIPIVTSNDLSRYEYIQFKQSGESQLPVRTNLAKNKFNIRIEALANTDLETFIILDEATGDQIQARGSGNLIMEIPSDGDLRLNGNYIIEEGKYNFAFKQMEVLNYRKEFTIERGSTIKWNGNLFNADLDVAANTQIKARLYDLIINEQDRIALTPQEISDAQLAQLINLRMIMNGSLATPELKFKIGLIENRSVGTYAYQKLQRINANERELLNQVAGLLLVGQFLPPEGLSGGASNAAISAGAITNMSELFSTVASSQISNFANKALGIEDLYIGLRYKNYALTGYDPTDPAAYLNRNEAGFNVRKNFFGNRLIAEIGGVYDWGRPSSQGDVDSRLAGDFRVQYLLSKDGKVRMNIFRNSNYDAIFQQTIGRQGAGVTYRKSFNNFSDWLTQNKSQNRDSIKNDVDTLGR